MKCWNVKMWNERLRWNVKNASLLKAQANIDLPICLYSFLCFYRCRCFNSLLLTIANPDFDRFSFNWLPAPCSVSLYYYFVLCSAVCTSPSDYLPNALVSSHNFSYHFMGKLRLLGILCDKSTPVLPSNLPKSEAGKTGIENWSRLLILLCLFTSSSNSRPSAPINLNFRDPFWFSLEFQTSQQHFSMGLQATLSDPFFFATQSDPFFIRPWKNLFLSTFSKLSLLSLLGSRNHNEVETATSY